MMNNIQKHNLLIDDATITEEVLDEIKKNFGIKDPKSISSVTILRPIKPDCI